MSVKDEIIRVFKRKVMAFPDGAVVHMGDCRIYDESLGICTCGLHHWLMQSGEGREIYPNFLEEKTNDALIFSLLGDFKNDNLYIKEGEDFVLAKEPEPVSEEKFNEMINEMFKKKGNEDD